MSNRHYDEKLDARKLQCPLPLLRTKKALSQLLPGQILYVLCTDPSSSKDFQAFAKQTGHQLLEVCEEAGEYHFLLEKKA